MTAVWSLYLREMLGLWVAPLAWLVLFTFLLLQGVSFYLVVDYFSNFADLAIDQGPVQSYFSSFFVPISILLTCPMLTMGVVAEERRSGTIESLLTAPISPAAVVSAKYAAVFSTYALLWLPTLLYIFIIRNVGPLDWFVIASSYAGVFGVGGAYLAVGVLMSTLTRSQLASAALTVGALFGLFIVGVGEQVFDTGALQQFCAHVSMLSQLDDFSRGIVRFDCIVFDTSLTAFCLFLAVRVMDSWRWG